MGPVREERSALGYWRRLDRGREAGGERGTRSRGGDRRRGCDLRLVAIVCIAGCTVSATCAVIARHRVIFVGRAVGIRVALVMAQVRCLRICAATWPACHRRPACTDKVII